MTDPQNDKLDQIIQKLDSLISLVQGRTIAVTTVFPTDKLDKIIQILERLEAKGGEKT